MNNFGDGLSELHKALNAIIRKPNQLEEAKKLFLTLHTQLHISSMTGSPQNEVDALLGDLAPQEYRIMPTAKDETIAWVLWHLARIEDLTIGILAAEGEQLFDTQWKDQLCAPITDTGNALNDDEIMELSRQLNVEKLVAYRTAVGKRTQDFVKSLSPGEMKRKVSPRGLEEIMKTGGLTNQEDSHWLLDYWGKKDVAGLLLMPPTRHVLLHLNSCCRWKQHIRENKKCFRSSAPLLQ